jgi:cell division protein FtsN
MITTAASDRLFHVQIGPFRDPKEAEITRSHLQGDGYNPILKK